MDYKRYVVYLTIKINDTTSVEERFDFRCDEEKAIEFKKILDKKEKKNRLEIEMFTGA